MDMSKFIIAKSDQLNADDLGAGPITVTITGVRGVDGDQPVAVSYDGDGGKPYKPCKSMRRVMVAVWGKYADKYVGKSMTLYCDPKVMFGGMEVGGIRISHMSDLSATKKIALNTTRGKKGLFTVQPLTDVPQQAGVQPDFKLTIELEALARPGNIVALKDKWQSIGPDARKALGADLLDRLKAACEVQTAPPGDVPFDQPQQTGADYDGV